MRGANRFGFPMVIGHSLPVARMLRLTLAEPQLPLDRTTSALDAAADSWPTAVHSRSDGHLAFAPGGASDAAARASPDAVCVLWRVAARMRLSTESLTCAIA